ncbi:MAG: N-acetyl-gamma-glutamyl-phosphate reductase [Myxococcaceae bacterium]
MIQAAIFGASGFAGIELTRLLARHSKVALTALTSDRWVGESVSARTGATVAAKYVAHEAGLEAALGCDVALLATPAETSHELVPKLVSAGVRVVDLSGAFRLKDVALYPKFYGFTHAHPALLEKAVYGMPELSREAIRGAKLITNPGCYPTAAALGLAPLTKAKLIEERNVVINAASGVSGAGRKASEEYSFMEVSTDFRPYKTLKHQHTPEIEQATGAKIVFTPHLLPLQRGIVCTTVASLKPGVTSAQVKAAFADAYAQEPLVTLTDKADAVRLASAALTPRVVLGATAEDGHVVVVTAIDNLLKGAASQAVQNLNLSFGFSELEGIQ